MSCDIEEMSVAEEESEWIALDHVDPACFACGPENLQGLQMRFDCNGHQVRGKLEIPGRFRGWSNLVHGGILSTILDETMGWAVITLTKRFMLTRSMTVSFKRPVRVGDTVTAIAEITEQPSERRALVTGEIRDGSGAVCVVATADFALLSKEQFRKLQIMPDEDLEHMSAMIR